MLGRSRAVVERDNGALLCRKGEIDERVFGALLNGERAAFRRGEHFKGDVLLRLRRVVVGHILHLLGRVLPEGAHGIEVVDTVLAAAVRRLHIDEGVVVRELGDVLLALQVDARIGGDEADDEEDEERDGKQVRCPLRRRDGCRSAADGADEDANVK